MSVNLLLKYPPSSFTNLKSQSLQVTDDVHFTPMTTAYRNTLTPEDGKLIFNFTDDEFQGYYNGVWNPIGATGPTGPIGPTGPTSIFTTATGTLISANIDNLFSTPVELIPGQGAGTVIVPVFTSLQFVPGGTPYVDGEGFTPVIYRGVDTAESEIFNEAWPMVLNGSTGIYACRLNESMTVNDAFQLTNLVDNAAIEIADQDLGAHPNTGNGTIKWTITYTVQDLA